MSEAHARLSASAAHKWLNCPMSLWMEDEIPEPKSSFAEEGTKAHALAELLIKYELIKSISIREYADERKKLDPIDPEMQDYISTFVDYVKERYNSAKKITKDALLLSETRLDYSCWAPEGFGTGDVVILADRYMEIIDLKYGKGVRVVAQDNPQLKLYALGAINEYENLYDIEEVYVTIFQPRLDHISSHLYRVEELMDWGYGVVLPGARKALYGKGSCKPGPYCDAGFCRARPICRAYAEQNMSVARFDFAHPSTLTEDEIAEVLQKADAIAHWARMVKDYALDQMLQGREIPGYKAVEGRSNRSYASEQAVFDALDKAGLDIDDYCITKPVGITEMQKKLGKAKFDEILGDLIVKPTGAPTIALMTDNRPALHTAEAAANEFKDLIKKGE